MRKFLMVFMIGLLMGCYLPQAWATPDSTNPAIETTDAQVKATPGTVYGLVVAFSGVTAGDKITLKDSTDGSGTALITVVAPAANGTIVVPLTVGVIFNTAIYYDVTVTGGAFAVTVQYF